MSDTVIEVENLGKKYILSHRQEGRSQYRALRDVITDGTKSFGKRILSPFGSEPVITPDKEEFWALKDVSFEIKRGDRVGIIGRNGAGKSTLLKILSRITEPTTGRIKIQGRVASLLEVGTGFHPELTGRENIYLNGAILGMRKEEIHQKFDEIVDFSEVEKFLDTPVKRYSSGMYVRLAFAVAAYLEPEILIVDEVLAVGDAQFQKKCLQKMDSFSEGGEKTVLFVSHNLTAVERFCSNGLLLSHGKLIGQGDAGDILNQYMSSSEQFIPLSERQDRKGSGQLKFSRVIFLTQDHEIVTFATTGEKLRIEIDYETKQKINLDQTRISIVFKDHLGNTLFSCPIIVQELPKNYFLESIGSLACEIFKFPLPPGSYKLELFSVVSHEVSDWIDIGNIEVKPGDFFGTGKLPHHGGRGVFVDFAWFF